MKKTIFALPFMLLMLFCAQQSSAQITAVNSFFVSNASNCPLEVQAWGLDANCGLVCTSGQQSIPPATQVAIPFGCLNSAFITTTVIGVFDPGSNQGFKAGNGCGTTPVGTIIDCQGIVRTITFTPPNSVSIN